jgi:hypothetical protein
MYKSKVGAGVGAAVGAGVKALVGVAVGSSVGAFVGAAVGSYVYPTGVGAFVGVLVHAVLDAVLIPSPPYATPNSNARHSSLLLQRALHCWIVCPGVSMRLYPVTHPP